MSKLASVICGTIELPSGKTVEVGSKLWYGWLEHPETKSFRVNDGEGYTARKETAKGYWYAYRKVEGKLHKRYIGVSEALTVERLAEVEELFNVPTQPKLPKDVDNSIGNNSELHNELGNLRTENETLKAKLRSQLSTWQMRLTRVENNLADTNAHLLRQYDENRKLEGELAEVRSQLSPQTAPQDSKILDWPDAADLLNQLKSKRKKSKTDLQDVEAILEMLPEMPAQQPQPEPQTQTQLPDLYAARDKLFEMPSLGGWKLEKGEKRERFWAFANALIEESAKLDPNYSLLARLQSDLKQEQEYSRGIAKGMSEEFTKRVNLEKRMGLRKL
jgi:hypothetical protein